MKENFEGSLFISMAILQNVYDLVIYLFGFDKSNVKC